MNPRNISRDKRNLRLSADIVTRYQTGVEIPDHLMRFGRNFDGPWRTGHPAWWVECVDFINYALGPHAGLDGGRGWDAGWQTAKPYWLIHSIDLIDYTPDEYASLDGGEDWDAGWQTAKSYWLIHSIDLIDYTPDEYASLDGGEDWDDEWRIAINYARLLGEDDANGYSVGTGDAPYTGGIGLATPSLNNVDIVNISGSDNGFRVVSGGIAWALDPSESWESIQIGCLVHIPVTAATGLGADSLRIGVCHGAGGIPGQVADASVGNAIFWRSVTWAYNAASGTMQAAASGAQQLGKIVAGTLSTTSISTISRVGAISSAPAVVRCPVVITITKGPTNWTVAVARRTTTTAGPGYDRDEDIMRIASALEDPASALGAQHFSHSNSIAFSASDGNPDTFFLQFANAVGAYFSGIYIARMS
jgi:hypothetical protein